MAVAADITQEVTELPDYTEAIKFNKRIIQQAQVGNAEKATQEVYTQYYNNAASKIYFNWSSGELPLNITMTKGILTESDLLSGKTPEEVNKAANKKVTSFIWDAGTQAIIRKMWYLSKSRSAQRG